MKPDSIPSSAHAHPATGAPAIKPTIHTAALAGPYAPTYTEADALAFMKTSNLFGATCVPGATCTVLRAVFMTSEQANTAYHLLMNTRTADEPVCVVEIGGTFRPMIAWNASETFPYALMFFDGRTGNLIATSLVNALV